MDRQAARARKSHFREQNEHREVADVEYSSWRGGANHAQS